MSKPNQYTAQQMIDALTATRGMITFAARKLDCAPNTIRRYIKEYPTVAEALHDLREQEGDAIELALYDEGVNKRNYNVLMFLAKTKHKGRGYVERSEHVLIGVSPELAQKFAAAALAAGVSPGDALEAFVQELADAHSTADSRKSGDKA